MSDIKYCPSCGTSLSLSALFCHKCGQKQKAPIAETMVSKETTAPETEEQGQPQVQEQEIASEKVYALEQDQNQNYESLQSLEQTPVPEQAQITQKAHAQSLEKAQTGEVVQDQLPTQAQAQEQIRDEVQKVQSAPDHKSSMGLVPPNQSQQSQPAYYPQNTMPQSLETKKGSGKKKFPWFFTGLWTILFIAVCGWGYYLYYLYSAGGDYPQFTEDAQRIVLFTVSIALLIYTVSLKLSMKKFRAFPTIILVIALLVIFYLFSMVELTDGDWLHDTISGITDSILPASGN